MTDQPAAASATDTKSFSGDFLVWRRDGQRLRKGLTKPAAEQVAAGRFRAPQFRHPDFASADREAQRLAQLCPGTTFVIIQEVGQVRVKGVACG